ncbi:MAG: ParB/RepB/Spo0J family partition protein [Thermofilaceae archaeon]
MGLERFELIPIEKIDVPERLRKDLGDIEDLKRSIKIVGSILPIIVRPKEDGRYALVVGERRLQAFKELGYTRVPAIIRSYDPLMAELAEIEENLRRKDYDSLERAKAIARYYEIVKQILGEPKPGRPEALTPEQVEKAKQLRAQGKSLSEIAGELKVGAETVRRHLREAETAVQASSAESAEKIVPKLVHVAPVLGQESASVPEKKPELEVLPERSATRAVAEELDIDHATIVRAAKTVDAIRRYPALERLRRVSDVQRVARVADNRLFGFTRKDVEEAVALALEEDIDPVLALYMQKIPREQWDRIIEVYREGKYPREWILEAASLMVSNPEKQLTIDRTLKLVVMSPKEYRVKVWYHFIVEKLEEAAAKAGLTVEQYIAIAAIEKLYNEGLLDELYYDEAVKFVKRGGPPIVQ